ncbi:hypothetical protein JZO67_001283 [Enterococcus sp. 665A]|uniref:Uncharacterized protein n=1 Tax=Candidatus Enterococcus ferrettii TaxID=2815324 RepID=A0ABV0ENA3_9ENTE|nr:hypothetical protein [Enterococcus sp. 665A]
MLFTRLKEKEDQFKNQLKIAPKRLYFFMYVLGLMFYGMGSYLFLNELLVSMFDANRNANLFYVLGVLTISAGLGLLLFLFYQFYKRVSSKDKARVAIRNYVLVVLISGVALGLIGEGIYRSTAMSYEWVKSFIWVVTTYIQGVLRFVFIYYCLTLLLEKPFSWKNPLLKKMLLGVFLLLSISIGISLAFPMMGSLAMFIADLVIAIGVVYKELIRS